MMQRYRATVLGEIWWPMGAPASTEVEFSADDDAAAVESAEAHFGDFSKVTDFQLVAVGNSWTRLHRIVKNWDSEDNEFAYLDTLGAAEDE